MTIQEETDMCILMFSALDVCSALQCLKRAVDVCYADAPSNEDDFFVASVFKGPTIRSVDIQPNLVMCLFVRRRKKM